MSTSNRVHLEKDLIRLSKTGQDQRVRPPNSRHSLLEALAFAGLLGCSISSYGIDISSWSCQGACGTLGADGVVTLPPSGENYGWVVSTNSGPMGLSPDSITTLVGPASTTGARITSPIFSATVGDELAFFYNYVTSDGGSFGDYAWARLVDDVGIEIAILFTARTTPGINTVPGFSMPPLEATLTPPNAPVIPGGPGWSPLGSDSGACFDPGCGYTGWVSATYTIPTTGDFQIEIGVVNWSDSSFQTGLAFDGVTVGGEPIEPAPVPALGAIGTSVLAGLLALLALFGLRRRP